MDNKTITISRDNWNRLWDKKRKLEKISLNEVITELLNRDDQAVQV